MSRISSVLVVAAAVGLAACGSSDDDTSADDTAAVEEASTATDEPAATLAPATAPATTAPATAPTDEPADDAVAMDDGVRTIETARGPVEVPADPQRVVVLDEYAGMGLQAVGVTPVVVYGTYGSVVGQQVLEAAGAEIRPIAGFTNPSLEDVAAADPDLIVYSTEGGLADIYDDLSAIAPTVELPYNVPFREAVGAAAAVVGQEEEAERVIGVLDEQIDELAAEVATDPMSLSVLADTYGMVFAASMESPMSLLIEEVGFDRPAAQLDGEPDPTYSAAIMISTEVLDEHDADQVVVLEGAFYDPTTFLEAPTFNALPAVQDGRYVIADGDLWYGTFPFAIYWLLEDLAALHGGEGQDGIGNVEDDVDQRWAAYEDLITP